MEKVVNIIGLAQSAVDIPDTGENWVLNVSYKKIIGKKIHKMFFMDDFTSIAYDDSFHPPADYGITNLIEDNPDVEIISRVENEIKNLDNKILGKIKAYPLNDAIKLASGGFFTSTIAYALCYAILEKVDRIRLYGLEIWAGSDANEYCYQRPCIDFWIAFAIARGIKVEVPYLLLQNISNNQNYYGYVSGELKQNFRR
jgi:hypothetical protein